MTPDRHDETPEDAQHGVLPDAGAIDAASIGVLAGPGDGGSGPATSQLSVTLPAASEDDLEEDDDVVVDEIDVEVLATGDIILEDLPPAHEVERGDDRRGDEAADAIDDQDAEAPVQDAAPSTSGDVVDADVVEVEVEVEVEEQASGVPVAASDSEIAAANEPVEGGTSAGAATTTAEEPVRAADAGTTPDRVLVGEAVPFTGSLPTTRREAHHAAAEASRSDRVPAVERVHPPQSELTLASKRLGEIDDKRESSDLLTADRLLDRSQLSGAEPEGMWQQLVYSLSRHRINLGDSRKARARKELNRRIAAPLPGGARFVPVLSRKGGVGKTTVTTLLGMSLAEARDDRVIAVDANPDRGTLAERIARPSGRTVRDLARTRADVAGFNDISTIVARDETRLDVLASDSDPRVSEAFSDLDYRDVAEVAAHYYSIVLTDTGTGIVHSVMGATLALADELVIVAGLSVDEARLASETLTWLETNGYADQVRNAVVVLNNSRPGAPLVRENEVEAHFRTRVRGVIRMPYDPLIGTGSAISFRDLQPATRQAARELAAAVVEGLRTLSPAV